MKAKCPGAAGMRTPTLKRKDCPECGAALEIFSDEASITCGQCGFVVYDDEASCFQWCKHAEECLGEDLFRRMKEKLERQ